MSLSNSEWFFCIVYTSLTGSLAYGFWKLIEIFLKKKKKYRWIILLSKMVILFWTIPFIFLLALDAAQAPDGGWYDDFGITPVLYVILKCLFFIWATGFIWQLVRYLGVKYQWRKMCCYSLVTAYKERQILEELCSACGIRRKVSVRENVICRVPLVGGVLCPVILLPAIPQEEKTLRIIIGHELTHIKHRDLAWKYLLAWLLRVHWFNPLFSRMFHDIMEWNEFSCDMEMCSGEGALVSFKEYFGTLLGMVRKDGGRGHKDLLTLSLHENKTSIERRIRMMKNYQPEKEWKRWMVALMSLLFMAAASLTSYAAGKGLLYGYTAVRVATEKVTEEELQEPEELLEEIILAGTKSDVVEMEAPLENGRSYATWTIPVNNSKRTPEFFCSVGDKIIVTVYVEPGDKLTRVGIIEPSGDRRAVSSKGVITHTFVVEKDGKHRVYVENQSDVTIEVDVNYRMY